jgi:hypothetical protein
MRYSFYRRLSKTAIFFAAVNFIAFRSVYVQSAAVPPKVVIAHAGMNARTVALWPAQEQKFFAKYGTDAQLIFIRQAPMLVAGMSAVEASIDLQMGHFDDSPNATERVIGNVMRFYLEFQGTPLATIDAKENRKARDEYLAGKRMRA